MSSYFSMDEENKMLKEKIISLEKQLVASKEKNNELKGKIDDMINDYSLEILEYFNQCGSIRKTARKYNMDMEELYESIPEWDGCRDGLQSAYDYHECRMEVIGRNQWDDEHDKYTEEEFDIKKRTPEPDELVSILKDYKDDEFTLYEIADNHNLWINNLFRILKDNKVIENEIDAKGYDVFYTEHNGSWSEWDGKSDLGLIEQFYKTNI
jgi:hypothetical protein